jgi:hypothetical protein
MDSELVTMIAGVFALLAAALCLICDDPSRSDGHERAERRESTWYPE